MAQVSIHEHTFAIASTHLAWQPERTDVAAHLGRAQLQELLNALDDFSPTPWLLAGDLNATSTSCVLALASAHGFEISARQQRPWDTTNINRKRRKLDYILAKPTQWDANPGQLPALSSDEPMPSAIHPSDHLPLAIHFSPR